MKEDLTPEARAVLEAVVVGDRRRDDDVVRELATRDNAFALRLQELDEVQDLLQQTAEDAQRSRNEAHSWSGAPGEEHMRTTLGLAQRPGRSWKRLALIGGLAAAGVAALLYLTLPGGSQGNEPIEPVYMGQQDVRLLHPRGQVASYAPVRWEGELPEGGEFLVSIYTVADSATDGTSPTGNTPTLRHRTREHTWTPSAVELETLGERILVEVLSKSRGGRDLGRDSALATR